MRIVLECPKCGHKVGYTTLLDYLTGAERVVCPHCEALIAIKFELVNKAEFIYAYSTEGE